MTRPLRIEFEGALYHITSRGNDRQAIFFEQSDRRQFLERLVQCVERYHWICHAYCLMENHYHLLIETPIPNLSKGMRHLNGSYTQELNNKYQREGHIFQGRYKSILVQKECYLIELARYIVLNPVRSGIVRTVGDWPWSSYLYTSGEKASPYWLTNDVTLQYFSMQQKKAEKAYKKFVADGIGQPSPWCALKNQVFLGDDEYVMSMQGKLPEGFAARGIPKVQLSTVKRSIEWYVEHHDERNTAITLAYKSGHYTQSEIAEYFAISHTTVSRVIRQSDV